MGEFVEDMKHGKGKLSDGLDKKKRGGGSYYEGEWVGDRASRWFSVVEFSVVLRC